MNIFYKIDCEQIIKLAEDLSYLGADIADLFRRALNAIESLGESNRWRGNSYNTEIRDINNFYLDRINNIINEITVVIPEAIVKAVNFYAKADSGKTYIANISYVQKIEYMRIIESDKIVFYESDIKEGMQQFSNYLNSAVSYLQEYKEKFNICGMIAWNGRAMDEYDIAINKIIYDSKEIVSDMNRITTYNLNKAREKLNSAESKNLITTTLDGGITAKEQEFESNINTEFYDKFLSGKTDGSFSSIAELTKEKFVNYDKKTDMYDMNVVHVISDMYKDGDKTTADCSSYVSFVLYNYFIANGMYDKLEILKTHRGDANGKRKQ